MNIEDTEGQHGLPEGETAHDESETIEAPDTDTEQTEEAKSEPEPEPEPKPKDKPWFQKRIDEQTRKIYDGIRRNEALEAELSQFRKANPDPARDADQEVQARAEKIVAQRQFDEKCNNVYSSGAEEFADFDEKLGQFRQLGGLPQQVLEAVAELPDAHKVLYSLGSNMEEAARIFSLSPMPMAVALAKLSAAPAKAKPVSNAPPPIKPVIGTPKAGEPDPDKMTTAQWVKWRQGEVDKNR